MCSRNAVMRQIVIIALALGMPLQVAGNGISKKAPGDECKQTAWVPTPSCAIEVAKKEIAKREGASQFDEPLAVEARDKSGWIVTAARLPPQPGASVTVFISKRGRIIDYRGGM